MLPRGRGGSPCPAPTPSRENARMTAHTVQSSYGTLRGTDDGGVAVFRGIPYAQPPVGAQRFQPPAPPLVWSGVRDATRFGPAAMQPEPSIAPALAKALH